MKSSYLQLLLQVCALTPPCSASFCKKFTFCVSDYVQKGLPSIGNRAVHLCMTLILNTSIPIQKQNRRKFPSLWIKNYLPTLPSKAATFVWGLRFYHYVYKIYCQVKNIFFLYFFFVCLFWLCCVWISHLLPVHLLNSPMFPGWLAHIVSKPQPHWARCLLQSHAALWWDGFLLWNSKGTCWGWRHRTHS